MKLKKVMAIGLAAAMIMGNGLVVFGAEPKTISTHPEGMPEVTKVTITNIVKQTDGSEIKGWVDIHNGATFTEDGHVVYCTAPVKITVDRYVEFTVYVVDANFEKYLPVSEDVLIANDGEIVTYEDTGESAFVGSLDSGETLTITEDGTYFLRTGAMADGSFLFVVGGDAPADTTASKPAATTPVAPANPAPVSVPVAPANPAPVAAPVAQPKPAAASTTYTVQEGDTLAKLAKKYYGDGKQYTKIFEANKDKLKSPHLIKVGQTLAIPK